MIDWYLLFNDDDSNCYLARFFVDAWSFLEGRPIRGLHFQIWRHFCLSRRWKTGNWSHCRLVHDISRSAMYSNSMPLLNEKKIEISVWSPMKVFLIHVVSLKMNKMCLTYCLLIFFLCLCVSVSISLFASMILHWNCCFHISQPTYFREWLLGRNLFRSRRIRGTVSKSLGIQGTEM